MVAARVINLIAAFIVVANQVPVCKKEDRSKVVRMMAVWACGWSSPFVQHRLHEKGASLSDANKADIRTAASAAAAITATQLAAAATAQDELELSCWHQAIVS